MDGREIGLAKTERAPIAMPGEHLNCGGAQSLSWI